MGNNFVVYLEQSGKWRVRVVIKATPKQLASFLAKNRTLDILVTNELDMPVLTFRYGFVDRSFMDVKEYTSKWLPEIVKAQQGGKLEEIDPVNVEELQMLFGINLEALQGKVNF